MLINLGIHWHIDFNRRQDNIHVLGNLNYTDEKGRRQQKQKTLHSYLIEYNPDNGEYIDHKDNNGLNNCKYNLRVITNSGNLTNRKGANRNSKTGIRNAYYSEDKNKYVVQLWLNKKNTILGEFNTPEEAEAFAEGMRNKYYNRVIEKETIKDNN